MVSFAAAQVKSRTSIGKALLLGCLLAALLVPTSAEADISVCATGSAAGQCLNPNALATDTGGNRLYVADPDNNRIDVFDSTTGAFLFAFGWKVNSSTPEDKLQICTTATGCQAGSAGNGAGQVSGISAIAVDNVSAEHYVYVAEEGKRRVEKFKPNGDFMYAIGKGVNTGTSGNSNLCTAAGPPTDICGAGSTGEGLGEFTNLKGVGVDPVGNLYVADNGNGIGACPLPGIGGEEFGKRVQKFSPAGTPTEVVVPVGVPCGQIRTFVVNATGDFYIGNSGASGAVRKFHPDGTAYGPPYPINSSFNLSAFAVGAADSLLVADDTGFLNMINEYSALGSQTRTFYGPDTDTGGVTRGLAVFSSANGDLFIALAGGVTYISYPDPGPIVREGFCEAPPAEVGNTKATFVCQVNPEAKATSFKYEFVADAKYQVNGFTEAASTGSQVLPGEVDFKLHQAKATLAAETLAPETEYHVRIVATNADSVPPGSIGEEFTLVTKGGPEVLETWATKVTTATATIHAVVDPVGVQTTGFVEYVDDQSFKTDGGFNSPNTQVSAEIEFGNGESPIVKVFGLTGLQARTLYHYRLHGEYEIAAIPGDVFGGEELLLTQTVFPDPDPTICPNDAYRTQASALLPDCRAYEMVTPLDKDNGDILTRINITGYPTNLDQTALSGNGFTYSSYRAFADPDSAPYTSQYLATRTGSGWSSTSMSPPWDGPRVRFELENEFKAFSPELDESWMLGEGEPQPGPCAPPGFADLFRRTSASGAYQALSCTTPNLEPTIFLPELEGFSTDAKTAVFRVDDALTPDASGAGNFQVYLSTGLGQLHLVSVLPNGIAASTNSSAGTALEDGLANHNRSQSVLHSISDDGTRVFWTAGTGSGPLFLRQNAAADQSASGACNEAGKACTVLISSEASYFQIANPQGTRALYSIVSGPNSGDLYEYDVAADTSTLVAEGVLSNILGASTDLSRVYLASSAADAEQEAEGAIPGKPNVYLYEGGEGRLVGTLSSSGTYSDAVLNNYGRPAASSPVRRTARASADGSALVFMSNSAQLADEAASYDNTDASSPTPCGQAESICDYEVYLYDAEAEAGEGALRCISCNPSRARPEGQQLAKGINGKPGPMGAARVPLFQSMLYQGRYVSDEGSRAYFNSVESLVAADQNGKEDVYQWETPGSGSCTIASPDFVASSQGCLRLISGGTGNGDSEFLDATSSGGDVFFTTLESLVVPDYGLIDVYDARANGGLPPPPPVGPECEGETCQTPTNPPPPQAPGSLILGAGNVVEKPCPKGKVRRGSRCVKKPCPKGKVRKGNRCVKKSKAKGKASKNRRVQR